MSETIDRVVSTLHAMIRKLPSGEQEALKELLAPPFPGPPDPDDAAFEAWWEEDVPGFNALSNREQYRVVFLAGRKSDCDGEDAVWNKAIGEAAESLLNKHPLSTGDAVTIIRALKRKEPADA